ALTVASGHMVNTAFAAEGQKQTTPRGQRSPGQERVIDFEAHYLDPDIFQWLHGRKAPPLYNPETGTLVLWGDTQPDPSMYMSPDLLLDVGEKRIAAMDGAGVDVQLLSSTLPMDVFPANEKPSDAMRKMNDGLAKIIAARPDRFKGMAALAPHDPQAAAKELRRCIKDLGFVGWQVHSHFYHQAAYADDPRYMPIWETAAELDIPVYIHPTLPVMPALQGYGYELAGSTFGFAIETSILMVRLLLSGLFEKLPTLKVIQAHMGETLPMLVERMDEQIKGKCPGYKLPKLPGDYWRSNVWCSVSGCFSKSVFALLQSQKPIDKILFGSDYPYENYPACTAYVNALELTEEERAKIYYKNAATAFRIF
ncbi:amidohydrolase family protein, partial [Desulfovibrio sp. OttesenSCG-928-M16]|nr:amidohydrolase family protein [Desulfovibrio sp. OttesenSCG-928-M16]MDL2207776.1 amidohydrolase family protein [Desulfovibrio sp. OttesenSCG-928-M16]